MYLADTNILLRFLLLNDAAYPAIRQAVRTLKARGDQIVATPQNNGRVLERVQAPDHSSGRPGIERRRYRDASAFVGATFSRLTRQPCHL